MAKPSRSLPPTLLLVAACCALAVGCAPDAEGAHVPAARSFDGAAGADGFATGADAGGDVGARSDSGAGDDTRPADDTGGPADAGPSDASSPDVGTPDGGMSDAGTPDAGTPDAGTPDGGTSDAGTPDGETGADGVGVGAAGDAAAADGGPAPLGPPPTGPSVWAPTLVAQGHNDFGKQLECNDAARGPGDIVFVCTSLGGLMAVDTAQSGKLPAVATAAFSAGSSMAPKCHHVTARQLGGSWRVWVSWRGDNHQPTPTVTALTYTGGAAPALQESHHLAVNGHSFEGMAWQGGKLWVAAHGAGLDQVSDVSGQLAHAGTVSGLANAWDAAPLGAAHLAVADGGAGLKVVATNASAGAVVGAAAVSGMSTRLVVDTAGQRAYVAAGVGGLAVVSVANPTKPQLIHTLKPPSAVADVALSGTRAVLAAIDRVYVADVAHSGAPTLLGARRTPPKFNGAAYHRAVETVGDRVFSVEWAGVSTWKLASAPQAPALVTEARRVKLVANAGVATERDVVLRNVGNAWLWVSSATLTDAPQGLTVVDAPTAVAPGGSVALRLRYTGAGGDEGEATLNIHTDDPHQPVVTVAVDTVATPLSLAKSVMVQTPSGTPWSLSDAKGKVRLISYFSTFCPMAWTHYLHAHRLLRERIPNPDLVMVGALADPGLFNVPLPQDDSAMRAHFVASVEVAMPVGFDVGGGKKSLVPDASMGAPAPVPVDVLIGRDGRVLRVEPRYDPWGMASDIEAALAAPAPSAP